MPALSASPQTLKATQVTASSSRGRRPPLRSPCPARRAAQSCAYSATSAATEPHRSCVPIALWCLLWSLWLLLTPPDAQSWAFFFFFCQEFGFGRSAVRTGKQFSPAHPWLAVRRCAGYSSSHHPLPTPFSDLQSFSRLSLPFLYPLLLL